MPPRMRPATLLLGIIAPILHACAPGTTPALVVATPWPEAETRALADAFAQRPGDPVPIRWVRLARGIGPEAVAAHRAPFDVILGGPASAYRRLTAAGAIGGDGEATPWRVARRSPFAPKASDPRDDPAAIAGAEARLEQSPTWAESYAALVRSDGQGAPSSVPGEWVEGAAVAPGARNPEAARAFLSLLGEIEARPPLPPGEPDSQPLLADLLGATLVDAREELRAASVAVERAGIPPRWDAWMTQAPPWPPASITRMIERGKARGEDPTPLVEDLARKLVPDSAANARLLESWERPPRPIDAALLTEIAGADGGRLAREPGFRAWLRGEWRAWARQRYRRVAREAGKARP